MSLASLVGRFKTGTYVVTRTPKGTRVAGDYVPGEPNTLSIDASVQPVTGRLLMDLPEGQHAEESRVIYTRTELLTRTPTNDPDVITIGNEDYLVTQVQAFGVISGGHYRVFAERITLP